MRTILKSSRFWIALFCLIAAASIFALMLMNSNAGTQVSIFYKDKLIYTMKLSENETKRIELDEGYNEIEVKNGKVFVKSADCKNQVCVNSGKKSAAGSTIICAPHRLTVKIEIDDSKDADV